MTYYRTKAIYQSYLFASNLWVQSMNTGCSGLILMQILLIAITTRHWAFSNSKIWRYTEAVIIFVSNDGNVLSTFIRIRQNIYFHSICKLIVPYLYSKRINHVGKNVQFVLCDHLVIIQTSWAPFLRTWVKLNPSTKKKLHVEWRVGWNYLSISQISTVPQVWIYEWISNFIPI